MFYTMTRTTCSLCDRFRPTASQVAMKAVLKLFYCDLTVTVPDRIHCIPNFSYPPPPYSRLHYLNCLCVHLRPGKLDLQFIVQPFSRGRGHAVGRSLSIIGINE